jgi:hypothetical protein
VDPRSARRIFAAGTSPFLAFAFRVTHDSHRSVLPPISVRDGTVLAPCSIFMRNTIAAIFFSGMMIWLARVVVQIISQKVSLKDATILVKSWRKKKTLALASVSQINFHYHAAVGYLGHWEFVPAQGQPLIVDKDARGMREFLEELEQRLPGSRLWTKSSEKGVTSESSRSSINARQRASASRIEVRIVRHRDERCR